MPSSCQQKQLEFKDLNLDLGDGLVGDIGPQLRNWAFFLKGGTEQPAQPSPLFVLRSLSFHRGDP